MLHLILGPVHSGKSRYLQSVLTDLLQQQKEIFYIVPEQLSYETEKSFLDCLGVAQANRIRVITFTKLCEVISEHIGGRQAQVIDEGLKSVCMMTALQNISADLRYYQKGAKSLAFAQSMLTIIDEFKQCGITPEEIFGTIPSLDPSNLKDKLLDIQFIYSAYNAVLQNRFIDLNDRLRFCAEHLAKSTVFADCVLFFDAFDGFMHNQHQLIEAIMLQAQDIYISLPCDGAIYTENDLSVFANVRAQARKLLASAEKNHIAAAKPIVFETTEYTYPELRELECVLAERSEQIFIEPAEHITLVQAVHAYDELDYIAFEIKRLIARQGYRYRDFAIVARECDSYAGALNSMAEKYTIPVFFDKPQALVDTPLFCLLVSALCAAHKISSDSVFNMLKCGLLSISAQDISLVENYCYIWDIDHLAWYDAWTKNPNGLDRENEDTQERLNKLNQIRVNILQIIATLQKHLGDTVTDITKALYRFIADQHIPDALRNFCADLKEKNAFDQAQCQITAYDKMISVFNKLVACDDGRKITVEAYIDLMFACAEGEGVGTVPYHLDTVMFCSSDRARVTNAKVVFMLGVNQGKQPRLGPTTGLLSDHDRQTLISAGIKIRDDLVSGAIDEKFKFYASACAAAERVYFCYSLSDFAMQNLEPSYVITQLETMFPECKRMYYTAAQNTDFAEMFDKIPAFEKMVMHHSDENAQIKTADTYFSKDKMFSKRMLAISSARTGDFALSPDVAKALYGNRLQLSSTQIETFYKCPFAYFCRYGIGAKPIKKAELDAVRRGTLVHYYLEKFIRRHMKDYAMLEDTDISEEIEMISDEYLAEFGLRESNFSEQLRYIFEDLKNQILFMILDIIEELKNSEFTPVACELHIGKNNEFPPFSVSFAGGEICVSGVVDRVDSAQINGENYVRIVDYKTNAKKFRLNDVLYGLNMQMLLYLYAIVKNKPYKIGGVLYKPAKQPITEITDLHTDTVPAIQSNGLLLRDEKLIRAMDKSGRYLTAEIKGDQVSEKGTATQQDFEMIFQAIESAVQQMGTRLHAGMISAWPLKEDTLPCSYCEYKTVCLMENEKNCRLIESKKDKEVLAELEGRMQNGL